MCNSIKSAISAVEQYICTNNAENRFLLLRPFLQKYRGIFKYNIQRICTIKSRVTCDFLTVIRDLPFNIEQVLFKNKKYATLCQFL
ncbi:hypothetical protein MSIBF_A2500003 [groundwater metagenome]|uniref:Uncharacterized protein n=1 Tax=groundwater metagenome TaxID=717931 RepID=A0A098EAP5_9ZZZZ